MPTHSPRRRAVPPIPEPPWRGPRARAAARVPLTRAAILDAADRVLERAGVDGLSMRQVADELGTGPASLYWHVRNKEELLQLLFERYNDEIELPPPDPARWQEQLKELGRQIRGLGKRHRDYGRLSLGRVPSGRSLARFAEWIFELGTPLGLSDQVIAYLADFASLYAGAFAFEESLGVQSPTGEAMPAEQLAAMFSDYLRSLPAEQFPHLRRAAEVLFAGNLDERFEFGLELIVRGMHTYVGSAPGEPLR